MEESKREKAYCNPGIHYIGVWAGPRSVGDNLEYTPLLLLGFEPRTVRPVAHIPTELYIYVYTHIHTHIYKETEQESDVTRPRSDVN